MKKFLLVFMVWCFPITALAAEQNLIDLHRAAKMGSKECLACHGQMQKEVSRVSKIKTFHRVHLGSKLGTPKECTDCHQSIDLREGSAGSLRKQVDPQLCAGCHQGGLKGAKALFAK